MTLEHFRQSLTATEPPSPIFQAIKIWVKSQFGLSEAPTLRSQTQERRHQRPRTKARHQSFSLRQGDGKRRRRGQGVWSGSPHSAKLSFGLSLSCGSSPPDSVPTSDGRFYFRCVRR